MARKAGTADLPLHGGRVPKWLADRIARHWRDAQSCNLQNGRTPPPSQEPIPPHLVMPAHHDVHPSDVFGRRLQSTLSAAAASGPADFLELLLVPGVGPRTMQSLAMVTEVVQGAPCRFADPARFSFAHGGKDQHPFPMSLRVYDEAIGVLKSAIRHAKLGQDERLGALKRLDDQARRLERVAAGPSVRP